MTNSRLFRVAISAIAVIATLIVLAISNARGQTAEFVVPTHEAALIMLFEPPASPGFLSVQDGKGELIWQTDIVAPRIRQLRLRPGIHRLRIAGQPQETLNLAGGTWTILTISGGRGHSGFDVRRRQINLAGNQYADSSLSAFLRRHSLAPAGYRPISLLDQGSGMLVSLTTPLQ